MPFNVQVEAKLRSAPIPPTHKNHAVFNVEDNENQTNRKVMSETFSPKLKSQRLFFGHLFFPMGWRLGFYHVDFLVTMLDAVF